MIGNPAAADTLVALKVKVKVLKSSERGPDGGYLVVADATKAALLRVCHEIAFLPKAGQSAVLYNILVREDRLVTISKSAMFLGKDVPVPESVLQSAPQLPTDSLCNSCSLRKALGSPKGVRVDVKGKVVKVSAYRDHYAINTLYTYDMYDTGEKCKQI